MSMTAGEETRAFSHAQFSHSAGYLPAHSAVTITDAINGHCFLLQV